MVCRAAAYARLLRHGGLILLQLHHQPGWSKAKWQQFLMVKK
jgi:hypothetical protein